MAERKITPRQEISQARLKQLLSYDPDTGLFLWKAWGRGQKNGNVRANKVAGGYNYEGYWRVWVEGMFYQANILAWFYMTGEWPNGQVDHADLDKTNNRFSNLRVASQSQNKANSAVYKNNKLGVKGVRLHRNGQYEARIGIGGKLQYLGCYRSLEQAKSVYDEAASKLFGAFARS